MALFGKKKKADEETPVETAAAPETEADEEQDAPQEEELSTEDRFKNASIELSKRLRFMFPQQMVIGFYYAELQAEGYIDDFCCYATDGTLLEKDDIPSKCGMSLAEMVAREDKLEQAFFLFRKAAEAHTEKPCNAVRVMMLGNGQVKLDITSTELKEGEEDIRYGKFREMVEKGNPRFAPPRMTQEQVDQFRSASEKVYRELGTEFFSFLPDEDFKIGYFYAEISDTGVFYHNRLILDDGTILDGDEIFDKFGMDKDEAEKNRVEVVKQIVQVRRILIQQKQKPFSTITLSVTGKGEFTSNMGFGDISPEGEQKRLEEWKEAHKE